MLFYDVILLVGGCSVMGVAIWTLVNKHAYVSVLTTATYSSATYLLLIAGVLTLVSSTFGCCGALRRDKCLLVVYEFTLLLVFLLEALGGILAYVYEEQVMGELIHTLTNTFTTKYYYDPDVTQAIDKMQAEYQCCGAVVFSDWHDSKWVQSGDSDTLKVPNSCCKTITQLCGTRDHPSNIWYNGCIHQLEEELARHLLLLGAVGCGTAIIQVLGLFLGCCLYIKLKDEN